MKVRIATRDASGLWFSEGNDDYRYRVMYVIYDFIREEFSDMSYYPGSYQSIDLLNGVNGNDRYCIFLGVIDVMDAATDGKHIIAYDVLNPVMAPGMVCDVEMLNDVSIINAFYDLMGYEYA
jgi:hypothetical protein